MLNINDYESRRKELKQTKKQLRLLRLYKNATYYVMFAFAVGVTPTAVKLNSEPDYAYYKVDVLNDGTLDINEKKYKKDHLVEKYHNVTKTEVAYDEIEEKYKEIQYKYEIPNLTFANTEELIDNIDAVLDLADSIERVRTTTTSKTKEKTEYSGIIYIKDTKDFKKSNIKNEIAKCLVKMILITLGIGFCWKHIYFKELAPKYKETKEKVKKLRLELKGNEEEYKRY